MRRIVAKAEPRFDLDLEYGREAEQRLAELFDYLAEGSAKVEVKRKRIIDLWLYVEQFCDKGKTGNFRPSGISVSTAHVYAFAIAGTGIMIVIPTALLRESLSHPSVRDSAETDGTCPTRGKLVHLRALFDTYQKSAKAPSSAAKPEPAAPTINTDEPISFTADDVLRWG